MRLLIGVSWLLLGSVVASCHEAVSTPGSKVADNVGDDSEGSTLFGGSDATMQAAKRFALELTAREGSSLPICRNSVVPKGTKLGRISLVLGRREMLRLAGESDCEVTIVAEREDLTLPKQITLHGCHLAYDETALRVTRLELAVDEPTDIWFQKCLFRIGLWGTGRGDYALIADEELFVPVLGTLWGNVPGRPEIVPDIPN